MTYRPTEKWFQRIANEESRVPVYVLVVEGAPAVWSSGPIRPRVAYSPGDRVNFNSGAQQRIYQFTALPLGTTNGRTFVGSAWIKSGSLFRCSLAVGDGASPVAIVDLNLTQDWQRFAIAFTATVAGQTSVLLQIANQVSDVGNIDVWGMQLEERTGLDAVSTLYERTDSARYRKNLLYASEDTGYSAWTKSANCTTNTDLAPAPTSIFNTNLTPMAVGALEVSSYVSNQVYPSEGRYAVGNLACNLINTGGFVSRWMGTERPGASRVYMAGATVFLGESSLSEDEYQAVWTGYVSEVSSSDGAASYAVKGSTKLYGWDQDIMTNCDSVSGEVILADSGSPMAKFTASSDLSAVDGFYNGWALKFSGGPNDNVERQVLTYSVVITLGITTRTFTLATGLPNAIGDASGRTANRFSVYNIVRITGNPIDIYARILTGQFARTGTIQTAFPITAISGATPTGLNYAYEELDVAQIQAERDVWYSGITLQFDFTTPEPARRFFEEQLFRVMDAYPVISPDGLFRVRAGRPSLPGAPVVEISDRNTSAVASWTRLTSDAITQMKIWGDFNPATREYQVLADRQTPDVRYSARAVRRTELIEIKSRGLRTIFNGAGIAQARADRSLQRFGAGGPEQITVKSGPILAFLEPGERVLITLKDLPVMFSGSDGKNRETFEVTRLRSQGNLETEVTALGFYLVGRPAFIGPDTMTADYASATQDDQIYAYASPVTGNFADGRAPYVVQ